MFIYTWQLIFDWEPSECFVFQGSSGRGRRRVEKAHDLWLEEPSWSNWLFSFRSVSHSALAVDRFRLAPSFIGRQRSDRVIHNLTLPVSLSPVPSSDCLQHYLGSFLSICLADWLGDEIQIWCGATWTDLTVVESPLSGVRENKHY